MLCEDNSNFFDNGRFSYVAKYCLTIGNRSFSRHLRVKIDKETNSSPNRQNFYLFFVFFGFFFAFSSFFIPRFSVRVAGQQLEIKSPHFTVFHRVYHFAW